MDSLILWEHRKKYNLLFALFNTLKNSFSQKHLFAKELLLHKDSTIYNPILYAFFILIISNSFLILTYLAISFDSIYQLFSSFLPQSNSLSPDLFKTFLLLFFIFQPILSIIEFFLFSFLFYLFFYRLDKKKKYL